MAEVQGQLVQNRLPQPLMADGPIGGSELQQLELLNMNLQAQVSQQNGELAQMKIRERELVQQVRVGAFPFQCLKC